MVAALFVLALFSFTLMGLFVVGLTIYSGLNGRVQRVDAAAAELVTRFARRRDLLMDAEAALSEDGPARSAAWPEHQVPITATGHALDDLAARDAGRRRRLVEVLRGGRRTSVPPEVVLELERRLAQSDNDVSSGVRAYNVAVTEFNQARSVVPATLVARVSGLDERPLIPEHACVDGSAAV